MNPLKLKIIAFGDEESFNFKEPAYQQIIRELRIRIKAKEKVAKENDNWDEKYRWTKRDFKIEIPFCFILILKL